MNYAAHAGVICCALLVPAAAATAQDICWDNNIVGDGFNARAISPPAFPDIRVADDFEVPTGGAELTDAHFGIIEDAGWTDGGLLEVTIYEQGPDDLPGAIIARRLGQYERVPTGRQLFERDEYHYWIDFAPLPLGSGKYWVGVRNPQGGGAGTNYWLTSDGGPDGANSKVGAFSLDGGQTWQTEGPGWQHAFELTCRAVDPQGSCCLPDGICEEGVSKGLCLLLGGEYLGDGARCEGVQCGVGACCFQGQCFDGIRRQDCSQKGGLFLGSGSNCDGVDCARLGACCLPPEETQAGPVLPDPPCCITTRPICELVKGGLFLGVGVPCESIIIQPIHEGPRQDWSHKIVVVQNCPDPGGGGEDCVEGPYEVDPWVTGGSLSANCHDFSIVCPLPADFFAPGSDPFVGTVCFKGEPLGPIQLQGFPDPLDFGNADTLVRRASDPFDRCDLPSADPVQVPIELIALNLVSIDPVVITFNGGQDPEEWDVRIMVDPDEQPGGVLEAVRTHCNGGTFDSQLDVCPQFIFTRRINPIEVDLDYCASCDPGGIPMESNDIPWVFREDLGQNVEVPNPVCTNFVAGVEDSNPTQDCGDCNGNGVRDSGDPCGGGGDGCDRCGDVNGDGDVNFDDVLIVLSRWGEPGGLGDTNCDGAINFDDVLNVLSNWD